MMISQRYKWVVVHHGMASYFAEKPKKIAGGFMDKNGRKFIGSDVYLHGRYMYENFYGTDK